jgi:hypothetical protein
MNIGTALARFQPAVHYLGNRTIPLGTVFGEKLYLDAPDERLTPDLVADEVHCGVVPGRNQLVQRPLP